MAQFDEKPTYENPPATGDVVLSGPAFRSLRWGAEGRGRKVVRGMLWTAALLALCGGGVARASEPFDFSKVPCRRNTAYQTKIEQEAAQRVDLSLTVNMQLGPLSLRIPWLYFHSEMARLNCLTRVADKIHIEFWMPDQRPLALTTGRRGGPGRTSSHVHRPVEPGRNEENKGEYVIYLWLKSFPSTSKEDPPRDMSDADVGISSYRFLKRLDFDDSSNIDMDVEGFVGEKAHLYRGFGTRFFVGCFQGVDSHCKMKAFYPRLRIQAEIFYPSDAPGPPHDIAEVVRRLVASFIVSEIDSEKGSVR